MGSVTGSCSLYTEILYHQLAQDDLDLEEGDRELEERRKILRPPRLTSRRVDALSIHNRRLFLGCLVLVEVIGLIAVGLTIHWVKEYKGGLPSIEEGIHFNWHPILMTVSLVFLYGNGALIYRVIPPQGEAHKLKLKIGHAVIMVVVFIIMVIGLQAAFDSHNNKKDGEGNPAPIPNLYTLHSWIGLIAALLFGIQWALGFSAFLFPKFSPEIRSILLPFHQYFSSSILCLAVAAALMGHLEKAIWSNKAYSQKGAESMVVNFTGVFLVLFVMGVTFLLSKFSTENPDYKEP